MAGKMMSSVAYSALGNAILRPVRDGLFVGEATTVASVFNESPLTIVFVVRYSMLYCILLLDKHDLIYLL